MPLTLTIENETTLPDGGHRDVNSVISQPVLPPAVAEAETSMLETVLQYGTAKAAAIGEFAAGKTGTTSNYGDAWFIGWDSKYTVAVWVGYILTTFVVICFGRIGAVYHIGFPVVMRASFGIVSLSIALFSLPLFILSSSYVVGQHMASHQSCGDSNTLDLVPVISRWKVHRAPPSQSRSAVQ